MNNLFSHIEYLLLSHDCVIVPGLGAFIAIARPAEIDYDNGSITPPSRTVMFNQAIMSDDGLLANSYARKYNLSFEEARQVVLKDSSMLKSSLSADKELPVGNLGVLKIGEEDNIVFTPRLIPGEVNRQLGFETLDLSDAAKTVAPSVNEGNEEGDFEHTTAYYQFRINKTFTRIAAAVMILAFITVAAILKPIPADNREQRASVMPVEAIIHSKAISTVADSQPDKETVAQVDKTENKLEETAQPTHFLIVATFSSNQEALNYVAMNSSDECPMQTVESKRMTRVAIASSNDKEQLRRQLNTREILSKYPNAWIWTRN